ncbi:guanine nucleotide-binding protein subunit alpha, partial [Gorgonomyces haynaldii]
MTLIHGQGFTEQDRGMYQKAIYMNVYEAIQEIGNAMKNLGIQLYYSHNQQHLSTVFNQPMTKDGNVFNPQMADAIKSLWKDPGIRQCFSKAKEYQLIDSAEYYFDNIDRIALPNYVPTDQDILQARIKSTGIVETRFNVEGLVYCMLDVGGQRSERKKWIHCFENVNALLFLVAISEYDQFLIEDHSVNRIHESLILFESICNSRWFKDTSIILFLNKIDLFKKKIQYSPLSDTFPGYKGGPDFELACKYLVKRFITLNSNENKTIYPHFTCATDTKQIRFVMLAVTDTIVKNNLRSIGL